MNEGPLGWIEDKEAEEGKGTLVVQGFVRGGRLSADRLVHLQNFGDFQVDKVRSPSFLDASSSSRLVESPS